MKNFLVLVFISINILVHAHAAAHDVVLKRNSPTLQNEFGQIQQRCFWATGVVRKIDENNSIVTIFHNAVPELGWPSMTMPFAVKDRNLLPRFSAGERVEFEFVIDAKNSVIVGVR